MAPPPDWLETLVARLAAGGLDLVRPFALSWWQGSADPAWRLPDLGRSDALALVIGNSRALWPVFARTLRREPGIAEIADPLDAGFVEPVVRAALAATGLRHEVRFSPEPPPRRPAIQRIAATAGLAHLGASFLSVHPEHGPWISLRAVAILDADPPAGPAPAPLPNPCGSCEERCLPRLRRALDDPVPAGELEPWRRWLAVRDACPVGTASRYGDDQLRYHYAKDREVLRRLAAGVEADVDEADRESASVAARARRSASK